MENLFLKSPSHVDGAGQEHIPFHAYLEQSNSTPNGPQSNEATYHQYYPSLPLELQLHILKSCDAPTLFNLIRTCSSLRAHTNPLFWADRDVWYETYALWMMDTYSFPQYYKASLDFSKGIQQLDIDSLGAHLNLGSDMAIRNDATPNVLVRTSKYWAKVLQEYPSVKRVNITVQGKNPLENAPEDSFVHRSSSCDAPSWDRVIPDIRGT
jgi:hypothetical protein